MYIYIVHELLLNAKIQKNAVKCAFFAKKSAIFVRRIIIIMSKIQTFLDFLNRDKCWCVVIFFTVMTVFIDSNCIMERRYVWASIDALQKEISELDSSYQENTRKLNELRNNPRSVVRVAREKYLMTHPGEDLFIIVKDDEAPEGLVVTADDEEDNPEV